FTLVRIAGEDDLDAPDLLTPLAPKTPPVSPTGNKKDRSNGGQGQSLSGGQQARAGSTLFRPKLEPEPSAALRAKLTAELGHISSADEAAIWAHRVMGAKNSLTAVDAERVEQAFQSKLATFVREPEDEMWPDQERRSIQGPRRRRSQAIDKSVL